MVLPTDAAVTNKPPELARLDLRTTVSDETLLLTGQLLDRTPFNGTYRLEFDFNADGAVDSYVDRPLGAFVQSVGVSPGLSGFRIRAKETVTSLPVLVSPWETITTQTESSPNSAPIIAGGVVSTTAGGGYVLAATVVDDTPSSGGLMLEIDTNSDGVIDSSVSVVPGGGEWAITPPAGATSIRARVIENGPSGRVADSGWGQLSLPQPLTPWSVSGWSATAGEFSAMGSRTIAVSGVLTPGDFGTSLFHLEIDADGDAVPDANFSIPETGPFNRSWLAMGSVTSIKVRLSRMGTASMVGDNSPWVDLNVMPVGPVEPPLLPPTPPSLQNVQFQGTNSPAGLSGALLGTLVDSTQGATFTLQIDVNLDGNPEQTAPIDAGAWMVPIQLGASMTGPRGRVFRQNNSGAQVASDWQQVTIPAIVGGGDPTQIPTAPTYRQTTDAEIQQARDNAAQARANLQTTIQNFNADVQAARQTYQTEMAALEAQRLAAYQAADAALAAAVATEATRHADRLAVIDGETAARIAARAALLADRQTTADANRVTGLASSAQQFNDDIAAAQARDAARKAGLEAARDAEVAAANQHYNIRSGEIRSAFDSAVAAAEQARTQALADSASTAAANQATAASTRVGTYATNAQERQSSVSQAQSTFDDLLASHPNSGFSPSLGLDDSGYLSAVSGAQSTLGLAVATAAQTFNQALDTAEGVYDGAIAGAQSTYGGAITLANSTRQTAYGNADSAYTIAVNGVNGTYTSAVNTAASNRDRDINTAQNDFNRDKATADSTLAGAIEDAQDAFDRAVEDAEQSLNGFLAGDAATVDGKMNGVRGTWTSKMAELGAAYDGVVSELSSSTATEGFESTFKTTIRGQWNAIMTFLENAADAVELARWSAYLSAMEARYYTNVISETELHTAYKNYILWTLEKQKEGIDARAAKEEAFVTGERAAATVLAKAASGDAASSATRLLTAQETFAKGKVDADAKFEIDSGEISRDGIIQYASRMAKYRTDIADARYAYTQAVIAAEKANADAVAGLQKTLDNATTVAWATFQRAENNASATRAQGVVAAEVVRTKAYADADEVFARAANAAGTVYANASASAYVTFVNAALGAQLIYAGAVTNAMVTAASAAADAQGAAISNALGNTADALAIGLAYASLLKARANAWAIETMGNLAADQLQTRTEVGEWQQQVSRDAAAAETAANNAAAAAVVAIKEDADEWAIAENRSIAAARSRAETEIDSDEQAAKDEADANYTQTIRDNGTQATRAGDLAFAKYSDDVLEIVDEQGRVTTEANEGFTSLQNRVTAAVQPLKDKLGSDTSKTQGAVAKGKTLADKVADKDEQFAVDSAKDLLAEAKRRAAEAIAINRAKEPVWFANKSVPSAGAGFRFLAENYLDSAANFFVGWGDGLTLGGFSGAVNWADPNYLQYINRDSNEYRGGKIVGQVHSFVIGAATTGGACTLNWAGTAARVYTAVGTGVGMAEVGQKIANGERVEVWDWLAFAPVAGALANRAGFLGKIFSCFVGETQVAVGWSPAALVVDTMSIDMAGFGTATDDTWSMEWIVSGTVLLGAAVVVRRTASRRLKPVRRVVRGRGRGAVVTSAVPDGNARKSKRDETTEPSPHPVDDLFRGHDLPTDWSDEPLAVPIAPMPATSADEGSRRSFDGERQPAARWLWIAPLLIALGCLWQGLPGSARREMAALAQPSTAVAGTISATHSEARPHSTQTLLTRRIDEIRPGMRVLAEHPDPTENAKPDLEIEPAAWRLVSLKMPKPDGGMLDISALWRASTLCEYGITVGTVIHANPTEIATTGDALVTGISACPEIEHGPGRIVTTTFAHSAANVIDLSVAGGTGHPRESIGTTANHPFWSEDRRAFVAAEELREGERLRRADGTITTVAGITRRTVRETVYNLEVDAEHVYHVGTSGVLVHNTGPLPCFGSAAFGSAQHENFLSNLIAGGLRGVIDKNRTGLGHTGVDLTFKNTAYFPGVANGFKHAELKPDSWSGLATFRNQLSIWRGQGTRGNVALFTYDAAGNISFAGMF